MQATGSRFYLDYMNSNSWRKRSLARRAIDNFMCQACGDKGRLEVHHRHYDNLGNEDIYKDLITLCKKCHHEVTTENRHLRNIAGCYQHELNEKGELMKCKAGIDIGGYETKICSKGRTQSFLSAVGDRFNGFGLGDVFGIHLEEPSCVVGEAAIKFSRFVQHLQARDSYKSDYYKKLFIAALSEITSASGDLVAVVGLPAKFWKSDSADLKSVLSGEHHFQRLGRRAQNIKVSATVTAQGMGALFNILMDRNGDIRDEKKALSRWGIIEVGSRTVNAIHVDGLQTVDHETDTFMIGGWDLVAILKDMLTDKYKHLNPDDFQIERFLRDGFMMYDGQKVDIQGEVRDASRMLSNQILGMVFNKWKSPGSFEEVLITGGCSLIMGNYIAKEFLQAFIDKSPVFSNVQGYEKFAQRIEG